MNAHRKQSGLLATPLLQFAVVVSLFVLLSFGIGRSTVKLSSACPGAIDGDPSDADVNTAPEGHVHASFETTHDYRGRSRSVKAHNNLVVADHGRCSDMGLAVLQDGGNAIDAAVVTALCQGIYNPMASGIGGGHIMLIR